MDKTAHIGPSGWRAALLVSLLSASLLLEGCELAFRAVAHGAYGVATSATTSDPRNDFGSYDIKQEPLLRMGMLDVVDGFPGPHWSGIAPTETPGKPLGEMYLARGRTVPEGGDWAVWLYVNFNAPNSRGERSYAARMAVNCASGRLAVMQSEWFMADWKITEGAGDLRGDRQGRPSSSRIHHPPVVVEKPNQVLVSTARKICRS